MAALSRDQMEVSPVFELRSCAKVKVFVAEARFCGAEPPAVPLRRETSFELDLCVRLN